MPVDDSERISLSMFMKAYSQPVINKDKNFLQHGSYIFTFGKYKDEAAFNILKKDRQYLLWLYKSATKDYMIEKFKCLLEYDLS